MARFLEILSQHPYLTTCFGLYILLSFWHHGTFILFKLRGPPAGEGLQEGDSEVDEDDKPLKNPVGDKIKRRFRIHFTEHGPSDSPLAVFESRKISPVYHITAVKTRVLTHTHQTLDFHWNVGDMLRKDLNPKSLRCHMTELEQDGLSFQSARSAIFNLMRT